MLVERPQGPYSGGMINHIVVWKLKDEAEGNTKAVNARLIQEKLEALKGVIPGLVSLEVGINTNPKETAADVVLRSVHESWAALDAYQVHPQHKAAGDFIGKVREDRRCVDWES